MTPKTILGFLLVMFGPFRLTCNAKTRFGRWCLANAGSFVNRKGRE